MKKLLSLILAFTLLAAMTAVAFGAEPTEAQLRDLKKYNIITGDDNGNLRPDEPLSRCEAAKIICTILCMPQSDAKESSFPDVAPGHWALGYIETAKALGIVSGDNEGNFRPHDMVTNEEYLKMLVVALGYSPIAEARGGFPAGYVTIAHTYGLTEDMQFEVNQPAKRSDVAILTHRALDTPLMFQTGFGSNVEYSVMDGKNGTDKKTLRLDLDPDFKYEDISSDNTENAEKTEEEKADFSKSAYTYEDVLVEDLEKSDNTYTFTDKNKAKSPTYKIDSGTYVHMSKDTLSLSNLKDGIKVRVLCTAQTNGVVKVLGIELYKDNLTQR